MVSEGRIAVYDAPGKPFEIRLFPIRPPRPDEVLVRIRMSTICRSDIHSYLGHRPNPSASEASDPIFQTPAWLITQANFPASSLRAWDRYITATTQVYRVQVVGHFDAGGPSARVEAVIDTNQGLPRILYWRDLTELGKGYDFQSSVRSEEIKN